jgi:hypothetical protein
MSNDLLEALARKIQRAVNESGHYMATLPAELAVLHELSEAGIHEFAARHGWTAVYHLHGEPIEFFKIVPA